MANQTETEREASREHLARRLAGLAEGGGTVGDARQVVDALDRYLAAVLHGWARRADVEEVARRVAWEVAHAAAAETEAR